MNGLIVNAEVLGLIAVTGITIIGFMIALNAQGITRISISFLMATFLLAVNVFAVVQYINNPDPTQVTVAAPLDDSKEQASRERMALAKQLSEEKAFVEAQNEQVRLKRTAAKEGEVVKMSAFLDKCSKLAEQLGRAKMQNYALEYSQLVAKAQRASASTSALEKEFETLSAELAHLQGVSGDVAEGLAKLKSAAKFYKLYYRANDSHQESSRERRMRSDAKEAKELFSVTRKIINSAK